MSFMLGPANHVKIKTHIGREFRIICKILVSGLAVEAVGFFLVMPLRRSAAAAMAIGVSIALVCSLLAALDSRRCSVLARVLCVTWLACMSSLAISLVRVLMTSKFDDIM